MTGPVNRAFVSRDPAEAPVKAKKQGHFIADIHYESGIKPEAYGLAPTTCACGFRGTYDEYTEHRLSFPPTAGARRSFSGDTVELLA